MWPTSSGSVEFQLSSSTRNAVCGISKSCEKKFSANAISALHDNATTYPRPEVENQLEKNSISGRCSVDGYSFYIQTLCDEYSPKCEVFSRFCANEPYWTKIIICIICSPEALAHVMWPTSSGSVEYHLSYSIPSAVWACISRQV